MNPERYTMPDIDLDIPDNRREEVLAYVSQNMVIITWRKLPRLVRWCENGFTGRCTCFRVVPE